MTRSLRRRLIGILLLLTVFTWLASALFTGAFASRVVLAQVDRQLNQYMDLVAFITEVFARQSEQAPMQQLAAPFNELPVAGNGAAPLVIDAGLPNRPGTLLNVWLDDRLLATQSGSPHLLPPSQPGFSFHRSDTPPGSWRLLSRYDANDDLWLVVGIETGAARAELLRTLRQALLPLLVILPLTLVLLWFGVSRGLRPLRKLAEQLARRSPQDQRPVTLQSVPSELEPVVTSLNALLGRLALALESEQRFTADAAHELKTPLAAIKAEVQLCQRLLSGEDGKAALQRIVARVDRANHAVEQLLTLARVDPAQVGAGDVLDLSLILRDELALQQPGAQQQGLEFDSSELGEGVVVAGNRDLLGIAVDNLLRNAVSYASDGSTIGLRLSAIGGQALLAVDNSCAALAVDELQHLQDRFYRVPGSRGMGAGLGLSIVQRIAEQHGGELRVKPLLVENGHAHAVSVQLALPLARAA